MRVGIRFKDLTPEVRMQYKVPETIKGIVITAVKNDSPASDIGIRVGNVISQIAQVNIESAEQAKKIINKSINQNMESILIQIFQDGFPKFAPLKLK